MASLMDMIMMQRSRANPAQADYTLGSRGNLQPMSSPFSPDGTLGNMGMRNMLQAQNRLASAGGFSSYGTGAPMPQPPMSQPPMPVRQAEPSFEPDSRNDIMRRLMGRGMAVQPQPGYEGAAGRRLAGALLAMQPEPGYDMPPIPPSGVPVLPPAREVGAAPGMQLPRTANAGAPTQLASAAPSVRESFMQRLLSGPNYQSNSMPVMPQGATTPQQINWGDPESAADFVRANQAYMGLLG